MMYDDILLFDGKRQVLAGVLQCACRMINSVEAMSFIRRMPVVQKVIMQQCAANQAVSVTG